MKRFRPVSGVGLLGLISVSTIVLGLYLGTVRHAHSESGAQFSCPYGLCTITVGSVVPQWSYAHTPRLYWLNDSVLVFKGLREGKKPTDRNVRRDDYRLFVWEVGKQEISRDLETWDGQGYCAGDGILSFHEGRKGRIGDSTDVYWRGEPFKEERIEQSLKIEQGRKRTSKVFNKFICDYVDRGVGVGRKGIHLRPEHGYLDGGALTHYSTGPYDPPYRLISPKGNNVPIDLPVPRSEISPVHIAYHSFIGAYFTYGRQLATTKERIEALGTCFPYWLLWPDGRTSRHCVPAGPWIAVPGIDLTFTKAGTVFTTGQPDHRGLYLVPDDDRDRVVKLFDGVIHRFASSPNGCRVAAAVNASDTVSVSPIDRRVAVVDFCSNN